LKFLVAFDADGGQNPKHLDLINKLIGAYYFFVYLLFSSSFNATKYFLVSQRYRGGSGKVVQ
jgi:hypothetical protein